MTKLRIESFIAVLAASGLVSLASACSDSGGATTPAPVPPAPADAGPTGTGTLRVLVAIPPDRLAPYDNLPPIAGALVAIDKPGGAHEEATTGADGMVTFTGIDWAVGTASVVGYVEGRSIFGVSDVSPATFKGLQPGTWPGDKADVVLTPFPRQLGTKVEVAITHKAAPANVVSLAATTGWTAFYGAGAQASLQVKAGETFSLFSAELAPVPMTNPREFAYTVVRHAQFDQPAPQGPLSIDLASGGTTLAPVTTKVRLVIPGGASGPLGMGYLQGQVTSVEMLLNGPLGNIVAAKLTDDNAAFDVTFSSVVVPGQTLGALYGVVLDDGTQSYRQVIGAPKEGDTIDDLVLPVTGTPTVQSITDPVPFVGADPNAVVTFQVLDIDGINLFSVDAPPGTKAMHLPKLPPVAQALLKTGTGKAVLWVFGDYKQPLNAYLRGARSHPFAITVP